MSLILDGTTGASLTAPNSVGLSNLARVGTAGQVLTSNGAGADPSYQAVSGQQPGEVCMFAMGTPPTGFLKCNGALVSRTTYAALFAAIGTYYSAGDGSTTFGLPELRGEFLRAFDDARGVDSGRTLGSLQLDAFQGHKHTLDINTWTGGSAVGMWATGVGALVPDQYPGSIAVGFPKSDGTNGTPRTAAETRPRNVALLACIKY